MNLPLLSRKIIFLSITLLILFLSCKEKISDKKEQSKPMSPIKTNEKVLLFFGDSLTAGMGLDSPEEAWPSIVTAKLSKENKKIKLINAGVSGDTTSGGLSRLDWVLSKKPDLFILELGANDMMRGLPVRTIKSNLILIINKVKEKYPECKILLVGIRAFPNLGPVYAGKFEIIFKQISIETNTPLAPFLLENVAGIRKLNQADGIHPTAEGHKIMADNIYPSIKKLL